MLRAVLGVIVGYAVWSVIWIVVNALLFSEAAAVVERGEPYLKTGPYVGVLLLSVVCSLAAGLACAAVAGRRAIPAALVTALALLGTGIAVQAGVWSLMPVWYHLSFLALLVPVTLLGAAILPRRTAA